MEWFDSTLNVQYMHPAEIKEGMRWAREVQRPLGPGGSMQSCTELTPVWDIGLGNSGGYYGMRYLFSLKTGELRSAQDNDRVPVDPEILPENLPPYEGTWITNEPFGFHDHKPGVIPDRHWYENSRALEVWTAEDGRVYRLLAYRSHRLFWVCRWDKGAKWFGPSRETPDLAGKQFDAIVEGRGW
ncbi:hypothetical protein JK364_23670 [Streptomyces sp. 110]|uniref:Uncharacterized protein n=1 Tax=Streptomyces endocoffeicus TaxID=2898945 RepID=A0ABS1PSG7_9ACTN|nr:hypothetical protein [Streptomyces endocoffeicus]MBL1115373.1 hypothetical protein [Streptomyces endocoffeicus]